jgi:hypothetical protein
MTQVWIVRYDQGLYVFKDVDTIEATVKDTFKTDYTVEKEEVSDQQVAFAVMQDGRIQDRIFANAFDVHEYPTVIAHVYELREDEPPTRPVRKEF